jgi:hypothetical protein
MRNETVVCIPPCVYSFLEAARQVKQGTRGTSSNSRPNDLSGRCRARTCDPLRVKQVLFQLS